MKARHKYKINYKSLLLNQNYCYYNNTSDKIRGNLAKNPPPLN